MCVCACVCLDEWKKEGRWERTKNGGSEEGVEGVGVMVYVCVCVDEWRKERSEGGKMGRDGKWRYRKERGMESIGAMEGMRTGNGRKWNGYG